MNVVRILEEWLTIVPLKLKEQHKRHKEQRKLLKECNKEITLQTLRKGKLQENLKAMILMEIQIKKKIQEEILQEEIKNSLIE
jgi:hypothetical protein